MLVERATDEGGILVGWRVSAGDSTVIIFANQASMPGIRLGNGFTPRLMGGIDYESILVESAPQPENRGAEQGS